MELVYLWVEDYKNIHKQGFNFSPRFECKFYPDYDGNGNLTENSKLEIIEKEYVNIFPENINITAIVGKNGSGKSSLIANIINDIIFNKKIEYNQQLLYCYLNDKKDQLYINSYLLTDDNIKSEIYYKLTHIELDTNNNYQDIVFSDLKVLKNFKNEYDKSFFYLYNNRIEIDKDVHNVYKYNEELLFYSEIDKSDGLVNIEKETDKIFTYFISLLSDKYKLPDEIIKIFIPEKMYINREEIFTYLKDNYNEEKEYRNFMITNNTEEVIKLETLIYLRYYIKKNNFDRKWKEEISNLQEIFADKHLIKEYRNILKDIKHILQKLYHKIQLEKKDIRYDDNKSNDYILATIIEIERIFLVIQNASELASIIISRRDNIYHDYEIDSSKLNKKIIKLLKNLPSYLKIDFLSKKGSRYSELSSGEKNILKLLFSIENIIFVRKERTYSFNILLDEIEDTLHPFWQKKLISWLIYFFSKFNNIQLNFIITTHSPFLISDLPKENIIFLDTYKENEEEVKKGLQKVGNCKVLSKDEVLEKKQTFGANIHTLLSDSFFMKDGLMGEFAKSKIEEVIKFLNNEKSEIKDHKEAESIINIIGEPILQKKLQVMLERYEEENNLINPQDIEKQIQELQEKLNRIKKNG